MRVTIAHNKSKQEVIQAVDRSFDEVFRGAGAGMFQVTDERKNWNGPVMTFALTVKMGFLRNPVKGTVEVTDKDVTIDADLGMLSKLIPEKTLQTQVEGRIRGLLT